MALGVVLTYVPAAQVDHVVHDVWFVVDVNVPAAHAEHVRLVVVVPALEMYWPAVHVVFAMHDVCPVLGWYSVFVLQLVQADTLVVVL